MSDIDEKLLARLQRLEREVERLRVGDKISKTLLDTYYLGLTAKAADSDKLDGKDSTEFLLTPSFSSHSATITASSGTFTTVSAVCRVMTLGKLRILAGYVYIGDKGTATGTLRVSIPTGSAKSLSGGRWAGTGNTSTTYKACIVNLNPSNSYLEITAYDNTTIIATGENIQFSIMYELA